uniref:Uncharacterized protein n=1 Tax=Oryza sativa subsp. japonica TaxID=39947 RepID=Q337W0_ORYSJ|nr:hypothetical protein LOC_Os10g29940 [Oryza sativa Japonica Group]
MWWRARKRQRKPASRAARRKDLPTSVARTSAVGEERRRRISRRRISRRRSSPSTATPLVAVPSVPTAHAAAHHLPSHAGCPRRSTRTRVATPDE